MTAISSTTVDPSKDSSETIFERGKTLFLELRQELEKDHHGEYVMINTETGDYVFGHTTSDVHFRFLSSFGFDAPGWCIRIGVSTFVGG